MTNQSFRDAIAWTRQDDHVFEGTIGEGWANGPAAYGGIIAAAFLNHLQESCDRPDQRVRSFHMHLCAPVFAEPTRLQTRPDRLGHTVSHIAAEMTQSGNTCATAHGTFGTEQKNAAPRDTLPRPDVPPPTEVERQAETPLTPEFAQYFDYRFCIGDPPMSGSSEAHTGGWLRATESMPHDERLLVALMDAWVPSSFPTYDTFRRTLTVDYRCQFFGTPEAGDTETFYLFDARVDSARDGYACEDAALWTEEGRLLARAQQTYAILD
jgi:acyl-CoA thioesterase